MGSAYILVVDDEPDIRSLLKEILEDEGYEVETAENGESARRLRRVRRPDLVLLDIWMPDIDGITLLKEWGDETGPNIPVIMMSGHSTVKTAVEATRLGAYDFIEKPLSLAKLLVTVERALEAYNLLRENAGLRRRIEPVIEPVGRSLTIRQLRENARRVAQHDTALLITGEPGSGKHLLAHFVHLSSPRRDGPFLMAGVSSQLVDGAAEEIFGREDGDHIHYGLLEQANGGTLFLDDIADMDLTTQARLLGALETGVYHRVGGREPLQANARVIAATHRDLTAQVQRGAFRSDLYYYLSVVPLQVPPLRDHCEDVPELLNFYIDYFAGRDNLPYRSFSVAAQNRLRNHAWPGNVRELKNLVQRLLIVSTSNVIELDEVESSLGSRPASLGQTTLVFDLPLREAREQFERAYFEHQLKVTAGNINDAAQRAGIERTHLYRKLRALQIDPKAIVSEK